MEDNFCQFSAKAEVFGTHLKDLNNEHQHHAFVEKKQSQKYSFYQITGDKVSGKVKTWYQAPRLNDCWH